MQEKPRRTKLPPGVLAQLRRDNQRLPKALAAEMHQLFQQLLEAQERRREDIPF